MANFGFKIFAKDKETQARVGEIKAPHGVIKTPAFIPVGTKGTIKGLTTPQLKEIGIQSFFVNTYHLYLQPGAQTIEKLGGLHKFIGWDKPLMTDSGGFQAFSLGFGLKHGVGKIADIFPDEDVNRKSYRAYKNQAKLCFVGEDGVEFTSHLDGRKFKLTPEISVETQISLGADLILALDECTSPLHDFAYTKKAMERTHKWALRCLTAAQGKLSGNKPQAIFGIVQGGHFKKLREESAKFISLLPFFGLAIGGDLGRSKSQMHQVLEWTIPNLPDKNPRHLLGIGEIDDIFEVIERGVDSFDCVMPTRLGRMGHVLTKCQMRNKFTIDITKAEFKEDKRPIDKECQCSVCQNYSRAYLNHLFRSHELLAYNLATYHNLWFLEKLVAEIRESIQKSEFLKIKRKWLVR